MANYDMSDLSIMIDANSDMSDLLTMIDTNTDINEYLILFNKIIFENNNLTPVESFEDCLEKTKNKSCFVKPLFENDRIDIIRKLYENNICLHKYNIFYLDYIFMFQSVDILSIMLEYDYDFLLDVFRYSNYYLLTTAAGSKHNIVAYLLDKYYYDKKFILSFLEASILVANETTLNLILENIHRYNFSTDEFNKICLDALMQRIKIKYFKTDHIISKLAEHNFDIHNFKNKLCLRALKKSNINTMKYFVNELDMDLNEVLNNI